MPAPSDRPAIRTKGRAVSGEVRSNTCAGFRSIALDRTQSASDLARSLLELVGRVGVDLHGVPLPDQRRRILRTAELVRRAQPAMGPFLRWSFDLREIARRPDPRGALHRWVVRSRSQLRRERMELPRRARPYLAGPGPVLTISHSASVVQALRSLPRRERPDIVWVLRSRPGGEGTETAEELRSAGLRVGLRSDGLGPRLAVRSRVVVIGADAVRPDGSVVHKVGTRPLARAARRAGVPVVVLAGTSKFVPKGAPVPRVSAWFDVTPARWVTAVVTERGKVRIRRR